MQVAKKHHVLLRDTAGKTWLIVDEHAVDVSAICKLCNQV